MNNNDKLYGVIYNNMYYALVSNFYTNVNEEEDDDYKYAIKNIVNEMLDLSKNVIFDSDNRKTFIFRKYYGVFDNGKKQSLSLIGDELGVSKQWVSQMLDNMRRKITREIVLGKSDKEVNKERKLSSLMCSSKYLELKNRPIESLELSNRNFFKLKSEGIYTIEDLLTYSRFDLYYLSIRIEEVEEAIHSLGLKFIDELTTLEKDKLLGRSSLNEREKSSASFLLTNHQLDGYRSNSLRLYTIEEVTNFVNNDFINRDDHFSVDISIMKELISLGMNISLNKIIQFYLKGKEDLDEQLVTIAQLNLSVNELKSLPFYVLGIKECFRFGKYLETIGDFTKLRKADLLMIPGIGDTKAKRIIKSVHVLGLCFADEVWTLREYCGAIHEQLESELSLTKKRK